MRRHLLPSFMWGAAALLGLSLGLTHCGTNSSSESSALNSYSQAAPTAPDAPTTVDEYNLDGTYTPDTGTVDPNTGKGGDPDPGGGGGMGGGGTGKPDGGTPPPTTMCTHIKDGGPTSCKDEATWKMYGDKACSAKGLTLHSISYSGACGRGHWMAADYECCGMPTPPPPPPPTCACTTDKLGGPMDCKDKKDWESAAQAACKAKGKILTRVDYHDSCGCDSYRDVELTCCTTGGTPPPPPPPPPTCFDVADGASGTCRTEADWKAIAEMTCGAKGAKLSNIAFGGACRPTGTMLPGYAEVKYQCCK